MSKKAIAIVFGVALVAAVVIAAVTGGIGKGSVPKGAIAEVDGQAITQAEFDKTLQDAVAQQAQQGAPAPQPGTPEYDQAHDSAVQALIQEKWIAGEAADQGIEVSDRQVTDRLAQIKQQQFKTEAEYQKALQQAGGLEAVTPNIKLGILQEGLQKKLTDGAPKPTEQDFKDFYDQNKSQLGQPETRDIRLILNTDPAKIDQAKQALEADPSDANWAKIAAQFSTDAASKDKGGARAGITAHTLEGDLDSAVFDAPLNKIEGPVTTPLGTYVFEVTTITPASTPSLEEARQQITQQVTQQKQQEAINEFSLDFSAKWSDLTTCADGFVVELCDNFRGPAPCSAQEKAQQACPPPVVLRKPIAPGAAAGASAGGGLAQGPHPAGGDTAPQAGATGLPGGPGGAVPVTPGG